MRISDWSSDVCSSDLIGRVGRAAISGKPAIQSRNSVPLQAVEIVADGMEWRSPCSVGHDLDEEVPCGAETKPRITVEVYSVQRGVVAVWSARSEEHTSELQSLMRISSAVFCLKKKNKTLKS